MIYFVLYPIHYKVSIFIDIMLYTNNEKLEMMVRILAIFKIFEIQHTEMSICEASLQNPQNVTQNEMVVIFGIKLNNIIKIKY